MRPRYTLALVVLAALVLVLSAQPGPVSASHNATRTFVSTTGNDANPCSAAAPCRSFAVAIGHTAAGGEVLAVDSGGYGPVTITKSVTIVGAPGAHVAITGPGFPPGGAAAIAVAAGVSDRVVLRNLYLTGPAAWGIHFTSGAALHIENVVASGFGDAGIRVSTEGTSETFISETVVRNNSTDGVRVQSSAGQASATLVRIRAENNGNRGVIAGSRSRVVVRDSVSAGNDSGFNTNGAGGTTAMMSIEHSTISENRLGIVASADTGGVATVDVSNSTITYNTFGVITGSGGSIFSRVNNTLERNTTNGTFTGSITAK